MLKTMLFVVVLCCFPFLSGCTRSPAEAEKALLDSFPGGIVAIGPWEGRLTTPNLEIKVNRIKLVHKSGNEYLGQLCGEPPPGIPRNLVPVACIDITVAYDGKNIVWQRR